MCVVGYVCFSLLFFTSMLSSVRFYVGLSFDVLCGEFSKQHNFMLVRYNMCGLGEKYNTSCELMLVEYNMLASDRGVTAPKSVCTVQMPSKQASDQASTQAIPDKSSFLLFSLV